MVKRLGPGFAAIVFLSSGALARPVDPPSTLRTFEDDRRSSRLSGLTAGLSNLSTHGFTDTAWYGGTTWAADSMRWEALKDGVWTFDTGVGSAFGPTGPNKPAGYHTLMEGWTGLDQTVVSQPWFRRSSTCAIAGSFSYWAGVTANEPDLCYAAGQGYGNGWNVAIAKTFFYPGSGNVTLSYAYAIEAEPGFDYMLVEIDTSGTGSAPGIELRYSDGVISGTDSLILIPGQTLRTTPGPVGIRFTASSDGSYSDEDGLYTSTCGLTAIDNVTLFGAIQDFADFETGTDGWEPVVTVTGRGGDFSNIVHSGMDLPPPMTFCACGMTDSVLVFQDLTGSHTYYQDNLAVSPWIDLKDGGDAGRNGKLFAYDVYAELPISNYIFVQLQARWFPSICPATGRLITTPFRHDNTVYYYGEAPFCTNPGARRLRDYSGVIETGAEQVQIAMGMINLCYTSFLCFPGLINSTPWFDNISFGIYGFPAPVITLSATDKFQDAFATDGTLRPTSTGRLDVNRIRGTVLLDTLVAHGDGGNTEVRLVFRVSPGPFTSQLQLAVWSSQWTPEPAIGPGWYSARMDTARAPFEAFRPGHWMTTFHESDPGFSGTDRTPDPANPSQLENEILPDHILTPGSRVDYFVTSRYIPPDPRNPGGNAWFVLPDTTGGEYLEVEILPSSLDADTTWNCTLLVDHHDDRDVPGQRLAEAGLTAALGAGSANHEGTRFDRWDVESPSSNMLSFGPWPGSKFGVTVAQLSGYNTLVWHSGDLSSLQLTSRDVAVIKPWLLSSGSHNRFWGSGDGLAQSMAANTDFTVNSFLRDVLGVTLTCNTLRAANCPAGTGIDTTYCLPLAPAAGAAFTAGTSASLRGNGCPEIRAFDVLGLHGPVATARGQSQYMKGGSPAGFASVTNSVIGNGSSYRTVLDGFAIGNVRATPADPHAAALCSDTGASIARTAAILDWLGSGLDCPAGTGIVGVPDIGGPETPPLRTALGAAHPNPMSPATRIQFTNGMESGMVVLSVFDVTGRIVRTLVNRKLAAGVHEVTWDGTSDAGSVVSGGMYFYRLTAENGRFSASNKLIVLK